MAAKETTTKPTTKAAQTTAPEVAKVSAGTADKGKDAPATEQTDPPADGLIYTQQDLDEAVATAAAAAAPNQAQTDELEANRREQLIAAIGGDGELDPDISAAIDKKVATARKEGFDAGKEEALEELAEKAEQNQDLDDDDYAHVVGRGIILGIILKMPANYRLGGEQTKLDEVDEFLRSIENGADRVVAVEIIKSLAESRPTELASPAYKDVVKRGLALVHGEAPETDPHADAANSPTAAFERMSRAAGATENTFPPEARPNEPPAHLQGEDLAAFKRMQQAITG